ncbi:hypothetical protein BK133_19460 [Paenibacillus sp. FSL H8-0548]|uniref:hypothetical protein n=1 Tax=Paenibacillus sp. FSL H8-0548 TaxID=1920422 RepID=UPI00096EE7A0|nr:hypothetical protein [Paenibacillus sp. FSL H8-0548]OMF27629.1 hypothetical protein BK133_19460 [Paenibacillus sp. FSL H8-0548]
MKKFRGKRRHFKKLWSLIEGYELNVEDDSWYDFWHRHLDFYGLGNNSLKVRREHIKAHIHLYSKFLQQLKDFSKPYQTWVCIHEEDSGADAVYVHTPNSNDENFPVKFDFIKWNCKPPNTFSDLIDLSQYNVGYYETEIERIYYIQSKYIQIP